MRMLQIILSLLMCSPLPAGDWTTKIAFGLAIETMRESESLVPRSECTVCGGTGRVKAGDTRTVVWRDCESCYDDSSGEPLVDPEPHPADVPERPRRILMFTASWCGPCVRWKRQIAPLLESTGWKIGVEPWNHIQYVDADGPLVERYGVQALPTFILVDDGAEVERRVGFIDQWQVGELADAD